MIHVNVNSDALVKHTAKLERLHRSAFPVAVRTTLNSLAFDMKKNTLLNETTRRFTKRNPSFFKRFSKVRMATGFDVKNMQSQVAMEDAGAKSKQAIEDLEQQERGGGIGGRAFIPLDTARVGRSSARNVRAKNRMGRIANIVNSNKMRGKNDAERFTKAAIIAGVGGFVIGNRNPQFLFRIDRITRNGRKTIIKKTPLYSYQGGRVVKVKPTKFMFTAANASNKKVGKFYEREAEKQYKRLKLK